MKKNLEMRIKGKNAKLVVMGLGYVGLPLAVAFARKGFNCYGLETDKTKIQALRQGKGYIKDLDFSEIKLLVKKRFLIPGSDFSILGKADTIFVCVPTPLDKSKEPDFSFVMSAVREISQRLKPGQLIIVESTIYPGMTLEVIKPQLEAETKLKAGKDFYLVMSPERIDPGNPKYHLENTPKVVGGINRASTELAVLLYQQIIERVVPVSSPTVAEMTKLLENTFRQINIGLANEIAIICDKLGINVWEVIDSASTKPFGFMTFYPGPGIGGHCIPVDPLYLSWKMKSLNYRARFIELASDINSEMPRFWVEKAQEGLNQKGKSLKNAQVLVLGISYKRDVDDLRESPALEIIKLLINKGARVEYYDPFIPKIEIGGRPINSQKFSRKLVQSADCIIIATDHSALDYKLIQKQANLIVDTRGILHRLSKS